MRLNEEAFQEDAYTMNASWPGHQIPLQLWQLSSSELQASVGKHVDIVSQSCQQHIPAGAGEGVVVAHFSSHDATQTGKIEGFVGHPSMHAFRDPPGQPLGLGLGDAVEVEIAEQSSPPMVMSTQLANSEGSGPTAGVPSVFMAPNQIHRTTVSPCDRLEGIVR